MSDNQAGVMLTGFLWVMGLVGLWLAGLCFWLAYSAPASIQFIDRAIVATGGVLSLGMAVVIGVALSMKDS